MSEEYVEAAHPFVADAQRGAEGLTGHDGDRENPGQLVAASVEECLGLARTWHAWDGRPVAGTMDGHPNTWTPHKALRRIADHLLDHLHQVEALLAGAAPLPDEWHRPPGDAGRGLGAVHRARLRRGVLAAAAAGTMVRAAVRGWRGARR